MLPVLGELSRWRPLPRDRERYEEEVSKDGGRRERLRDCRLLEDLGICCSAHERYLCDDTLGLLERDLLLARDSATLMESVDATELKSSKDWKDVSRRTELTVLTGVGKPSNGPPPRRIF